VHADTTSRVLELSREPDRDAEMNHRRRHDSSTAVTPSAATRSASAGDPLQAIDDLLWDGTRQAIGRAGLEISGELAVTRRSMIFEARESRSDRALVLKVLIDPDDRLALAAFRRERRVLSAEFLPSQLVPRYVTSVAGEEMQPFLVLERIDGQPLLEAAQTLDLTARVEVARKLFSAVETLHASNLQHGGLSAEHVLIDEIGRVRFLGFGQSRPLETGSRVRAALDRSKPQNRLLRRSPNRDVHDVDGQSDLQAAAAIVFELFTGRRAATLTNEKQFVDGRRQAAGRVELEQARVPAAVSTIIANVLRLPGAHGGVAEQQFQSASDVADNLSRWLDDRRQSRRRRGAVAAVCLGTSLALAVGMFAWAAFGNSPDTARRQELAWLETQAMALQSREHPAVAAALQRVEKLRETRAEHLEVGNDFKAAELLPDLLRELSTAVETGHNVDRAVPVRQAIAQLLGSISWVRDSRFISERLTVLEARFRRSGQQLDSGQTADAWALLQTLERDLAALVRDNAEAAAAARARSRFADLQVGIAERLRSMDGFLALETAATEAASAWHDGDWTRSSELFSEARQQLRNWLRSNETLDERVARELANPELADRLAQQREQAARQFDTVTIERDQFAVLNEKLEAARAAAQLELKSTQETSRQLDAKLADIAAARKSLTAELEDSDRSLRQARDELDRLRSEIAGLGRQQREQEIARTTLEQQLADLDRKLTTAERTARDAAARSETLRRELDLWKRFGGSEIETAIELARQQKELASQIAGLSGQDRQRAELLVREAERRLVEIEQQRSALLQKFSDDSSTVRAVDEQLPKLRATLVAAVRSLSEIEAEVHNGLQQQIAALEKRYEHLTTVQGLKPAADEPQELRLRISELTAQADEFEAALARLEAIDQGDQAVAREWARNLSFGGQSAGQRTVLQTRSGDVALRWIPTLNKSSVDGSSTSHGRGFWMLETEVTQALFTDVAGQTLEELHSRRSIEVDAIGNSADGVPIYFAGYEEARRFCDRLTEQLRREELLPNGWRVTLPSEDQWEHAARAGQSVARSTYVDEFRLAESAWFNANSNSAAQPVGRKAPNAWGLRDMVGNVYEWVDSSSPANEGVVRGASWGSPVEAAALSSRRVVDREFRSSEVGFRFVVERTGQ